MADKIIVIAIGGNSLIKNGKQSASFSEQLDTIKLTTAQITDLIESGYSVLITHGNGPQVGDLLIRSYLTRKHMPDIPLDIANALTQSQIGYMIQQSLKNELLKRKIKRDIVTIITQVVVLKNDPAFTNYTKPVGPFYSKKEAFTLQAERGWTMKEDAGRGYRRMVSSPVPQQIVEINQIKTLLKNNTIVIAGGGGGIPVYKNFRKGYTPTAAVIDKDLTSALIANQVNANILIISTSIKQAYINYNKPNQKPLYQITAQQALTYLKQGHFGKGSMEPKILASINFLSKKNARQAIITDPPNISRAIKNTKIGTKINAK